MSEHRQYTIEAQIACVRRELALRVKMYPIWVRVGRMKSKTADHELKCMEAVHDTLVSLQQEKPHP